MIGLHLLSVLPYKPEALIHLCWGHVVPQGTHPALDQLTCPDGRGPNLHLFFATSGKEFLSINALCKRGAIFKDMEMAQDLGDFVVRKGGELLKVRECSP